jgi:hypothetical protein
MADHQRIVDELRSALFAYSPETIDTLRAAVADYAAACDAANERLRRTADLLNRGLRGEAIQQADISPRLLDIVAALDFPEREQVYAFLQQCEIAPPPRLMMDVAADLNEAYATEEPLKALVTKHRLLALARAPLHDRIQTLRTISENDPNNLVWREDLHAYEAARLKEIQFVEAEASRQDDLTTLAELEQELHRERWSQEVPTALLNRTRDSKAKLVRKTATQRLEKLEPALNSAFSAFDLDKARRLRDQWQEALKEANLSADAPLARRAFPALQWISDEDAREQRAASLREAIAKLEHALDAEAPPSDLERLHHAVVQFEESVPETIEHRYRSQMAAAELTASRKHKQRLFAVVAAALLVAAGVGWVMFDQVQRRETRQVVEQFETLISNKEFGPADEYYQQMSKEHQNDPEIKALRVQLEKELSESERRKQDFAEILQKLKNGDPLRVSRSLIDEAQAMVKRDPSLDSRSLKILLADIKKAEDSRIIQLQEEFRLAVERLAKNVKAAEASYPSSPRAVEIIAALTNEAAVLKGKASQGSESAVQLLKTLQNRIDGFKDELENQSVEQQLVKALTHQVGNHDEYAKRLREYIDRFPAAARSTDFRSTVDELDLWKGVANWNDFVRLYGVHKIIGMTPQQAKQNLDKLETLAKSHGKYPQASVFQRHRNYIKAVTRRIDDEGRPISANLEESLQKWWIKNLWIIELGPDFRYYTDGKPPLNSTDSRPSFTYISGFNGDDKVTRRASITTEQLRAAIVKESPQVSLAKSLEAQLAMLKDNRNWESSFRQMLISILNDKETDAILRFSLLDGVLRTGSEGSELLNELFSPYTAILKQQQFNPNVHWLNPEDAQAIDVRRKARNALDQLPSWESALAQFDERARKSKTPTRAELSATLTSPMGEFYHWIGWLKRERDGWTCVSPEKTLRSGTLHIVRKNPENGQVVMDRLGEFLEGNPQLLSLKAEVGQEGRPVYLLIKK